MEGITVIQWNACFVSSRKKELFHSRDNNQCMSSVRENRIRKDFQKEVISEIFCQKTCGRKQYRPNKGKKEIG